MYGVTHVVGIPGHSQICNGCLYNVYEEQSGYLWGSFQVCFMN